MNAPSINLERNINSANPKSVKDYEFDGFRLDAVHLMLYENGRPVALAPKVVETLLALIEKQGEVVGKDELMDRLWADTFVEESNLTQNIYRLRKTLGKAKNGQHLIQSFKRRGYRFNGDIKRAAEIEILIASRTKSLTTTEETSGTGITKVFTRWHLLAAGLIGMLLLAVGVTRYFKIGPQNDRTRTTPFVQAFTMTRLTPDQNIVDMAISPDAKYLAFALNEKGKHSLWLKDLPSGGTTRVLPPIEEAYSDLVFSPDGARIYYTTRIKDSPELTMFRIPAFGGESRLVARHVTSPGTLSPDGKQIAFVRMTEIERSLIIAETDGGGERILSKREGKTNWYESWGSNLSWSPDGQKIALCGAQAVGKRGRYELIEVSVADGSERIMPIPDWNYAEDTVWLSDQSGLLVTARETETSPFQVWRISYPDGDVTRLTNDTNEYDDLSLSADSRHLVVRQRIGNVNLWTMPLDDPNQVRQLTFGASSLANDGSYGIGVTPGGKIVYTSPRDGNFDLWEMNADGTEQKQLTKNAGDFNGRPRISPDGKTIVFVSTRSGLKQLWRMEADGGSPRQLTGGKGADHPWISPDGAWIYFTFWRDEGHIIAKIPIDGGEIVPIYEKNNPKWATISPDGSLIFFGYYEEGAAQPWKAGLLSRESGKLKLIEENGFVQGWTADSRSLISARGHPKNLWLVPIDGGDPRQLTSFEAGVIHNFAVSPDFDQIAVARGNPSAEAVMITGF